MNNYFHLFHIELGDVDCTSSQGKNVIIFNLWNNFIKIGA